jgi:predicted MFS family arabinose efflux permease
VSQGFRQYLIVTAAYWGFTLSDGALRMLVLFHFFKLGYPPLTLAFLFLLYEAAGIAANLAGGWLATRFGIRNMLTLGLSLQVLGLLVLSALDPDWTEVVSVLWVLGAQGIAGIAKDITKTASKSAIKATVKAAGTELFRKTALFTGSKNATKGLGFFLGGALLEGFGFAAGLWVLAAALVVVLVLTVSLLPRDLGRGGASKSMEEFFAKSQGINILAGARLFLFGARDIWFVVSLPVFLYSAGWSFWEVGAFLASWTIAYTSIQSIAPSLTPRSTDGVSREAPAARLWTATLALVPAGIVVGLASETLGQFDIEIVLAGLILFGLMFAVTSSLHSYLVLAYAGSKKAAEDVGFYYAANAAGRLVGTLLSGLLFQVGGLSACLIGSACMLTKSAIVAFFLPNSISMNLQKNHALRGHS